jgi:aminobenzoyl-glutamate utilization protein B
VVGGHGHGCGHNLLGSAALLAATAVKNHLAAHGIKGRIRYYGCPAEEGGAAKVFMVREGQFRDVDIAITWHPSAVNRIDDAISLANTRVDFTFRGRASHAASAPHLGRSALDAVELMKPSASPWTLCTEPERSPRFVEGDIQSNYQRGVPIQISAV